MANTYRFVPSPQMRRLRIAVGERVVLAAADGEEDVPGRVYQDVQTPKPQRWKIRY